MPNEPTPRERRVVLRATFGLLQVVGLAATGWGLWQHQPYFAGLAFALHFAATLAYRTFDTVQP